METKKTKGLFWLIGIIVVLITVIIFFKESSLGTDLLWKTSDGGKWILPLVVVSSLIDSINPCAFSILLITVAFLFSLGKSRTSIIEIGSSYILGIFVVYISIGLGILKVLHLFNTPHFMAKLGAVAVIVFGIINLINHFFPNSPVKFKIPNLTHPKIASLMEKATLPTAFALGVLVGLCEFPCTGGPYLMILGLLHDSGTYISGLGYLLLYNLIFIVPLVIILLISSHKSLIEKVTAWKKSETGNMKLWGGVLMVILGIIIFIL